MSFQIFTHQKNDRVDNKIIYHNGNEEIISSDEALDDQNRLVQIISAYLASKDNILLKQSLVPFFEKYNRKDIIAYRLPSSFNPTILTEEVNRLATNLSEDSWLVPDQAFKYLAKQRYEERRLRESAWREWKLFTLYSSNADNWSYSKNFQSEHEMEHLISQHPLLREVVSFFKEYGSLIHLSRIDPGEHIVPHLDKGDALRVQISIVANDHAELYIDNIPIPISSGEMWYIDTSYEHWVHNKGPQSRLTFIVGIDNPSLIKIINSYLLPEKDLDSTSYKNGQSIRAIKHTLSHRTVEDSYIVIKNEHYPFIIQQAR